MVTKLLHCSKAQIIDAILKKAPKLTTRDCEKIFVEHKKNKGKKTYYSIIKKVQIYAYELCVEYTFEYYKKRSAYRFASEEEYQYSLHNPLLVYARVQLYGYVIVIARPIVSAIQHYSFTFEKGWKYINENEYKAQMYTYFGDKYSGSYLFRIISIPSFLENARINRELLKYVGITEAYDLQLNYGSDYETLVEMKKYYLLRLLYRVPNQDMKIIYRVFRDGYKIKEDEWCDYFDYIAQLIEQGLDYRNPKYAYPIDLKKEHQRLTAKIAAERKKRYEEEKLKMLEEEKEQYLVKIQPFKDLNLGNEKFTIIPLQDVKEFKEEGDEMHHCVFASNYFKSKCLIVSIKLDGKRMETAELRENSGKWSIVQCRGKCNQDSEYHKEIMTLLENNLFKLNGMTI